MRTLYEGLRSGLHHRVRRLFEPFQHIAQKRNKFLMLHGDLTAVVLTKSMLEKIKTERESLVNCVEETARVMGATIGVCLFSADAANAMTV